MITVDIDGHRALLPPNVKDQCCMPRLQRPDLPPWAEGGPGGIAVKLNGGDSGQGTIPRNAVMPALPAEADWSSLFLFLHPILAYLFWMSPFPELLLHQGYELG
jgi:hypothetical protein